MFGTSRAELAYPEWFLQWLSSDQPTRYLDALEMIQVWGLVGLAALARARNIPLVVDTVGSRPATRFARALGIDSVIAGCAAAGPPEGGRTVRLTAFGREFGDPSPDGLAGEVANLIRPQKDEAWSAIHYVLLELLRNVRQHSRDPRGGVVAAQLMSAGYAGYERDTVQVAVGDAGIGIPESLRVSHPEYDTAETALVRSLEPHISGTFGSGMSGSVENAGLGLFFIAEMAKRSSGRLLIATRGASLLLQGGMAGSKETLQIFGSGFAGNATPAVRAGLEFLESYALGG